MAHLELLDHLARTAEGSAERRAWCTEAVTFLQVKSFITLVVPCRQCQHQAALVLSLDFACTRLQEQARALEHRAHLWCQHGEVLEAVACELLTDRDGQGVLRSVWDSATQQFATCHSCMAAHHAAQVRSRALLLRACAWKCSGPT